MSHITKQLTDALEPFAALSQHMPFSTQDDTVLGVELDPHVHGCKGVVKARDIRRAWEAYKAARAHRRNERRIAQMAGRKGLGV